MSDATEPIQPMFRDGYYGGPTIVCPLCSGDLKSIKNPVCGECGREFRVLLTEVRGDE